MSEPLAERTHVGPDAPPTCTGCEHARRDHIYEEGACRPGYVCPSGCEQYMPASQTEGGEALDACREQRSDLLELLEVEREQHRAALIQAWHEGYGAGSSAATDGWLSPGSPKMPNPYVVRTPSEVTEVKG